ncbi:helix-turn-helix transcriptional regulator [Kocuria sp.]|uniref:helix-turn-helix transcriptional regulator n=1 Tax=Kocuria sp. TaxID=1871328 RepID=UPI0026DF8720|nr:hypothetical protein [Kocuria sp.]MDO5618269.1 hypothetical protein [Kocuria sp.]
MPHRGPRPTPRPASLTPAQLKVLRTVAALGGQGIRHTEIAETLGGHPNAVRPHLETLVRSNLLATEEFRDGHRGRPPRMYRVTANGHAALSQDASADNSALVGALTDFMLSSGHGPQDARRVGQIWAQALEQSPHHTDDDAPSTPPSTQVPVTGTPSTDVSERAVTRVVNVMDSLGFDPDLEPTASGHRVTLKACPMLELAQQNPEFICRIHEGLIAGVMHREGVPAHVELHPFATETACQVRINPHSAS